MSDKEESLEEKLKPYLEASMGGSFDKGDYEAVKYRLTSYPKRDDDAKFDAIELEGAFKAGARWQKNRT